jgi:hypothetical protein
MSAWVRGVLSMADLSSQPGTFLRKSDQMAKKDSDQLQELIKPAVNALKKVFTQPGDELVDNDLTTARLAGSVLATWSRLKQAERAQEAVYFSMARELASDRSQLEQYVKLSMPDVPLVKVLDAKKVPSLKDKND